MGNIMAETAAHKSAEAKELASKPWLEEDLRASQVTCDVMRPMGELPSRLWILGLLLAMGCMTMMFGAVGHQLHEGIGILGLNNPVGWGVYITNFVFWVGIGHAGTLISAVLFLFRQRWRNSINRTAEAMTIFAVMCAGIFPLIHTGRPWLAFWLIPYPNHRLLWVNFRSPLIWDVFAVTTYLTISALFWYQGLLPDLATVRDAAKNKIKKFTFGVLSLGWRGTARHWEHYEKAYWQFAWLATPLVLSVHS